MQRVKRFYKRNYERNVELDPMLAFNTDLDQNKIEECLLTEYFLKIVRLVVIILALSYFFGIFFLVVCEAVLDFQYEVEI